MHGRQAEAMLVCYLVPRCVASAEVLVGDLVSWASSTCGHVPVKDLCDQHRVYMYLSMEGHVWPAVLVPSDTAHPAI